MFHIFHISTSRFLGKLSQTARPLLQYSEIEFQILEEDLSDLQ